MKDIKQQRAIKKLRRNFFQEAMIKEIDLEYRRQLSDSVKRGIRAKREREKLLTSEVAM